MRFASPVRRLVCWLARPALGLVLLVPLCAAPRSRLQDSLNQIFVGQSGAAVVLGVADGRVLAAHNLPVLTRRIAAPGSAIKPFVLQLLLESGAAGSQDTIACRWSAVKADAFELHVVNASDEARARTAARSAHAWAVAQSGLTLHSLPLIEVYPTVEMFRDATGEPGWVAASTRGQKVRVQSPNVLHEKFESVLRHEFLHMLVEDSAAPATPLWFREGIVVYLGGDPPAANEVMMSGAQIERAISSRGNQDDMRQAYAQAAAMVRDLDRQHGRAQLLAWLRGGLPDNVRGGVAAAGDKVSQ